MPGSTWPTIGTEVPVFNVPLSSLNDGGQIVGLVDVGMGLDDAKISSTVTTIRGVLLFLVTAGFFLMSYRTLGRAGGM
ncbi:MAG TPA: hypothetical protein VHO48_09970 [Anaerolineaceae bacterium]|nr:hypothetical protein [Anaerolineaceae bacterium]